MEQKAQRILQYYLLCVQNTWPWLFEGFAIQQIGAKHFVKSRILRTFNGRFLRTFNSRILRTLTAAFYEHFTGAFYEL